MEQKQGCPHRARIVDQCRQHGLPDGMTDSTLAAIEMAGYELRPKAGGNAAKVTDALRSVKYSVDGMPGVFVVQLLRGEEPVMEWREMNVDGRVERSEPISIAGRRQP